MSGRTPADPAPDEHGEYPLDHRSGYYIMPRDLATFEPIMREPGRLMLGILVLIHGRVRHAAGWARGSKGTVWLERGQCLLGIREVAEQLGVSKDATQRALIELERFGLIVRDAGRKGSVVSVPNYGAYGENELAPCDAGQTQTGRRPDAGPDAGQTQTGRRTGPNERENGRTGERENGVSARRPLGDGAPGTPGLLEELFAHHLAACEAAPVTALARPKLMASRHVILETINHPKIIEASTEEIKRAIDVLAVQARAKVDAGESDPWWPLRCAWSVNVLADALAMPNMETARLRATKRSGRPTNLLSSVAPGTPEEFARYADDPK